MQAFMLAALLLNAVAATPSDEVVAQFEERTFDVPGAQAGQQSVDAQDSFGHGIVLSILLTRVG